MREGKTALYFGFKRSRSQWGHTLEVIPFGLSLLGSACCIIGDGSHKATHVWSHMNWVLILK